mgnify:CR=1 FL=1
MDLETGAINWSAQTRRIHQVDADYTPSLEAAISFYAPAARPVIEAAVQRAIAAGGGWDLELPFMTATGRPIWVRAVGEVEVEEGRPRRLIGAFQDITERREMTMRLADAAEQVHDLYDNAPCGYYSVDAQGRFIRINDLALAWLGCRREEVLHRLGPADFFTEAGRNLFRLAFPVFKVDGQIGPMEFELRSRDGSSRWVSVSATAVRDAGGGFVMSRSVMHDVTQVHEARIALSRLAKEQNAMLDNEVVGIFRIRDRKVVWKNSAAERMFGYDPDELLHQAAQVLCADLCSFEEEAQTADAALAAKGRHRTQLQMRRKGGELLWIDASGVLLSPATGESMWVLVDISQMKDYQSQVEHLAFHDALTQLPNRLLLADRLQHALAANARLHGRLAVCCLDLDGFKAVNDRHGHAAGDRLLVEVARRLQGCVRQGDTVARLGGDDDANVVAEKGAEFVLDAEILRVAHGDGERIAVVACCAGQGGSSGYPLAIEELAHALAVYRPSVVAGIRVVVIARRARKCTAADHAQAVHYLTNANAGRIHHIVHGIGVAIVAGATGLSISASALAWGRLIGVVGATVLCIANTIAVTIGLDRINNVRAIVARVRKTIAIDVARCTSFTGVTSVAYTIMIAIRLIGVSIGRAVIAGITNTITIRITLISIR